MDDVQLYYYNLQEIKENLSLEDIAQILDEYGAEPEIKNNMITARTIDHNYLDDSSASKKLYYYDNSHLFVSWTSGNEPFDIFQLVLTVENREHNAGWELPQAVAYIAQKFGYAPNDKRNVLQLDNLEEFKLLHDYERIKEIKTNNQEIELKSYDDSFLKHLPRPIITPWVKEGITKEAMDIAEICYDPKNCGIVIPHRDINNNLVGVRERTLIAEQAEMYGKYMPAKIGKQMYNHPLSYNLYNLNHSKDNIKRIKKAFVFESEKSCLKYKSYFGEENDISLALCGQTFSAYQFWLLLSQGAEEIIIGYDHDFNDLNSEEAKKIIKNLKALHYKYGNYTTLSFLWDKENRLGYKDSPIDKTKELFLDLVKERINIYDY